MESRMSRLDSMDRRIESFQLEMHEGFKLLDGKIDQRFMWTMAGIATSWLTVMAGWATIIFTVLHH